MYIFLNENNCGYGSDQGSLILFEVRKRVTEEKEINKKKTTTKTLAAYQILMNTYGECVCVSACLCSNVSMRKRLFDNCIA